MPEGFRGLQSLSEEKLRRLLSCHVFKRLVATKGKMGRDKGENGGLLGRLFNFELGKEEAGKKKKRGLTRPRSKMIGRSSSSAEGLSSMESFFFERRTDVFQGIEL
eukprot:TRINITY_DN3756_c1_g3_i4.p1 TRINITY_DN3756_c1_g3~~TRINITY_DN3756_c1_g3_i4.p1  ORF type:complete len:106 (+),score=19.57 TRINITY_DN3756_c1_g3_i4:239-556(+)